MNKVIKAPFNFVPLANQVYIPTWADQISQDIPFSDGVSGYIDLKITAQSPIFIRNGHTKEEAEQGKMAVKEAIRNSVNPDFTEAEQIKYNQFSQTDDGIFFIPATSVKGEVRNILEIMSFSKMRVDRSIKYAQREWYDENLYPKQEIQKDIQCGYLRWNKKKQIYEVTSHGKPYRIGFDKIDRYLNKRLYKRDLFKRFFSDQRGSDQEEVTIREGHGYNINKSVFLNGKEFDPKTASFKYKLVGDVQLQDLLFDIDETSTDYSTRLKYNPQGEIKGDIVFTGQPGYCKWNRPTKLDPQAGKFYEFVFPSEGNKVFPMDEIEFNYFKFIYSESAEWQRVEDLLYGVNSKGVPVFFRIKKCKIKETDKETGKEKEKEIEQIMDFGLAYLYKLPYVKSPADILDEKYGKDKDRIDLAECIFGHVDTNKKRSSKNDSLKGRVQFSNLYSSNAEKDTPVTLVLNSPKASYYPIYIKQPNQKGGIMSLNMNYQSYNDGQLSGWKRYVVRNQTWESKTGGETDSTLFPLKSGAVFEGKIRFHNLRPMELGALLSALTFHSTDGCYHLLGQGKPYGYGKTYYAVDLHCNDRDEDCNYFMALFERYMLDKFPNWRNSHTIKSLITLAKTEVESHDYEYMKLTVNPNINEFAVAKRQDKENKRDRNDYHPHKEYLQDFVSLQGGECSYPSDSITSRLKSIKEKADSILPQVKENIDAIIADFDSKLEILNEDKKDEVRQILQVARNLVCNPPEPLLPSELSSYIENLDRKETTLEEKLNEIEFKKYETIYKEALNAVTTDTNANKTIEDAIDRLQTMPSDEKTKWIEELQRKKMKITLGSLDISAFLDNIKVASINAFARKLEDRSITNEDIPFVVQKLKEGIPSLNRENQRKWQARKNWGAIEKVIGKDITDAIYNGIYGSI